MISIAFVNNEREPIIGSDPLFLLEDAINKTSQEIDNNVSAFLEKCDLYTIESEIMGELDNEKTLYIESENKNIFTKIGDAVIELFKKFQKVVKDILMSIKNIGFKNKSNEEKMREVLDYYKKNDPQKYNDIKDEVIVAYNNGQLNPIDMKSIKEISDSYDELVKLAKQKDVKPGSLEDKFNSIKKKFDNIDQSKVVKASNAAKTVITAAIAIVGIREAILRSKKNIVDCESTISEKNEKILSAIHDLESYEDGKFVAGNLTKAQILKNAQLWLLNQGGKMVSNESGNLNKYQDGILGFLNKHKITERQKFDREVGGSIQILRARKDSERAKEREKNREDSMDKGEGQNIGSLKFRNDNRGILSDEESNSAKNKAKATTSAQDEAMQLQSHQDAIRRQSRLQAQGKREDSDESILNNPTHQKAVKTQSKLQAKGKAKGTPKRTQTPPTPNNP